MRGNNSDSAKSREPKVTLIAGNQVIHAGFQSAGKNAIIGWVGQHLKNLPRINKGGVGADSSDYVSDLRRRKSEFTPSDDRLIFPEKKPGEEKLYTVLSRKV